MPSTTLKYAQTVSASPDAVYRAFTNATALREWLADVATIDLRPNGHYFLSWHNGYYNAGEIIRLQQDKEILMFWAGRDDPSRSKVRVVINPLDNGLTSFILEHLDLDTQGDWAAAFKRIERWWAIGMRNLISLLENGPDLRMINRPMMGIVFGDLEKKHCEELGVPVNEGLRIDSLVDGLGAQSAGLRKNDVIISLDGNPTVDFPSLLATLQGKQAGDRIDVGIYRGGEKKKVAMELSRRPVAEIPPTPAALSAMLAKNYADGHEQLAKLIEGVSETAASRKPNADEWSVNEILAHLIHTERDNQLWINELVFSQERSSDGFSGNLAARVMATASVYGSAEALLAELRCSQAETVALIAALPEKFCENKGSFWRMGYQLIELRAHRREHAAQISVLLGK